MVSLSTWERGRARMLFLCPTQGLLADEGQSCLGERLCSVKDIQLWTPNYTKAALGHSKSYLQSLLKLSEWLKGWSHTKNHTLLSINILSSGLTGKTAISPLLAPSLSAQRARNVLFPSSLECLALCLAHFNYWIHIWWEENLKNSSEELSQRRGKKNNTPLFYHHIW